MFRFFLVSSQVHLEKNALSEAAGILSNFADIGSFNVKLLPVGGLGLLKSDNPIEISESINGLIQELLVTEKLYYCYKIIPLEFFDLFSEEMIMRWVDENKSRILESESWRVAINKRHSSLNTQNLINQIASRIKNPVDLKNPAKIIEIEIIGKFLGLAILKPYQLLQFTNKISKIDFEIVEDELLDGIAE